MIWKTGMGEREALQSRLRNCLQTILEFESDLESLRTGGILLQGFSRLRELLAQLGNELTPTEGDVQRVERATAALLRELEQPLNMLRERQVPDEPIQ